MFDVVRSYHSRGINPFHQINISKILFRDTHLISYIGTPNRDFARKRQSEINDRCQGKNKK